MALLTLDVLGMEINKLIIRYIVIAIVSIIGVCEVSIAQTLTQVVKGIVTDQITGEGLIGANVVLLNTNPIIGTVTNLDGEFILDDVPVGRQSIEVSMLGYERYMVQEILITSGKEVILNLNLIENIKNLNEVVITSSTDNNHALNSMATLSSRQFSVEETQKYAGGLNDPARLVSSFAGVATPSISNNGISIRGNSPAGLLWRIEDVEVSSPNHFADLTIAGAGLLTALSSQMMGNSDFYTGAFPSEYGNATSGVFDINLRLGNTSQREYTLQAGLIGIDFATEGPFRKGKDASYLFNYRYSTLGLIGAFLPSDAGILKYQDLSFKLNFPTKSFGTFSIWSIAAYDAIDTEALNMEEWESESDREHSETSLYMFASGINHRAALGSKTFLKTALSYSGDGLTFKEHRLDDELASHIRSAANRNNDKITLQSSLTSYFNHKHSNRTGFYLNNLGYDLNLDHAEIPATLPVNLIKDKGRAFSFQFFSQSKFKLSSKATLTAGFHSQYYQLTDKISFEPRVAFKYQFNKKSNMAIACGSHRRAEQLPVYLLKDEFGNQPNLELDLMKSDHLILSFNTMLAEHLKLSIEPYYQYLEHVPVSPGSYISTLNTNDNLFFNHTLVSNGTGTNLGIDFTLERYLHKGFYFLISASIFDSKYIANDGLERNTRYNKNYVMNSLIGKEWAIGKRKNNLFSTNIRLNYLGGNRIESINELKSVQYQDVVYGEVDGTLSFAEKHPDTPILSFTLSYRKNKPKHSSVWSLQVLNATQTADFETAIFNTKTQLIEKKYSKIMVPNLSYKIEF